MKKILEISLVIKWSGNNLSKITNHTEIILEKLDNSPYKRDLPIHWLIPSVPFLESRQKNLDNLLLEIKTRMKSLEDLPVSAGYTGACLPLLLFSELQQELAWSITNPWKSGLQDIFGVKPEIIIPGVADFSRHSIAGIYTEAGFKYLGIKEIFPYSIAGEFKNLFLFHYPNADLTNPFPEIKKQVKTCLKRKYHYLLFQIDINAQGEPENMEISWRNLEKAIAWLARKFEVNFTSLIRSKALKKLVPGHQEFPVFRIANTPVLRSRLLACNHLRQKPENADTD